MSDPPTRGKSFIAQSRETHRLSHSAYFCLIFENVGAWNKLEHYVTTELNNAATIEKWLSGVNRQAVCRPEISLRPPVLYAQHQMERSSALTLTLRHVLTWSIITEPVPSMASSETRLACTTQTGLPSSV